MNLAKHLGPTNTEKLIGMPGTPLFIRETDHTWVAISSFALGFILGAVVVWAGVLLML